MRILWTIGAVMPGIAKALGIKSTHSVSWVESMSERLACRDDIQLAIACSGDVTEVQKRQICNLTFFVLPHNCNKKDYWQEVLFDFKPDVIHIFGTETDKSRLLVQKYQKYPIIISLQGILTEYQRHYYGGVELSDMLRNTTLIDIVRPIGFFRGRRDFIHRSAIEKELLNSVKYVEGRSTWDRVSALRINPKLKYYYCPRLIRKPFYEKDWDYESISPHSVFVHQGTYPIKGLHFVLEAVYLLKKTYPDIKLYIAGVNLYEDNGIKGYLKQNGYIKYIKSLMKRFDLYENIVFTGYLSAESLAEYLRRMNVVVIPSAIENAPNSLVEAQIVGTPVIASFVGGNMDLLTHNKGGFLYCYNEPNMLSEYIREVFDNKGKAIEFSKYSKSVALKRHDPEALESMLLNIYYSILRDHRDSMYSSL